jgi:hypothetical protein
MAQIMRTGGNIEVIDLDVEQAVILKSGDLLIHIWKDYFGMGLSKTPDSASIKRYFRRKQNKGICVYGGCNKKAGTGVFCEPHRQLNLLRKRVLKVKK